MKTLFPRRTQRHRKEGFSLVEVMMAMTLLAIVLMSLARVTMTVSRRGRDNSIIAKRTFAIIKEANKFGAMPWDSLALSKYADNTTTTITDGDFKYTRKLGNTATGTTQRKLVIRVTPALDVTRWDSVVVYRTKPAGSPLCVGC